LGFANWNFLDSYQAEYILLNNNSSDYSLDIISWKTIQKSLPNLAAQMLDEGKSPKGEASLFKTLENVQWWQKNVVPSYALSKADAKDLFAISKDLDVASTTILSLTISASGSSKHKAIDNVRAAAKFLRAGSAYLQLRNIINSYESETISAVANLQKKITSTEVEIGYHVKRAKSLEDLLKRYPGGTNAGYQAVDPGDSGAKYLPLSTQIIAVKSDIIQLEQNVQRYKDRLAQIALIKTFVDQAIPLSEKTFDGLMFGEQLLVIEAELRAKLARDDVMQQEILDQLRSQLLLVQTRFTKGLESNTAPIASKKGMIKTTAGAMAGAFFLMLLVLLGQRLWQAAKKHWR
jgi:hypothetical protein